MVSLIENVYPEYKNLYPKMVEGFEAKVTRSFDLYMGLVTSSNPGEIKYTNGIKLNMNVVDRTIETKNPKTNVNFFKFDFQGNFDKSLRD